MAQGVKDLVLARVADPVTCLGTFTCHGEGQKKKKTRKGIILCRDKTKKKKKASCDIAILTPPEMFLSFLTLNKEKEILSIHR